MVLDKLEMEQQEVYQFLFKYKSGNKHIVKKCNMFIFLLNKKTKIQLTKTYF